MIFGGVFVIVLDFWNDGHTHITTSKAVLKANTNTDVGVRKTPDMMQVAVVFVQRAADRLYACFNSLSGGWALENALQNGYITAVTGTDVDLSSV